MNTRKFVINAALAAFLAGGSIHAQEESGDMAEMADESEGFECHGVNACKGQGACGGEGHSCAGKNACKGKGWIKTTDKADCDARMAAAKKADSSKSKKAKKGS